MEYQEFTGKTVADALTNASVTLGVTSDRIEYDVIEKGSNGFLGIGSKNAKIRVKVKEEVTEVEETAELPAEETAETVEETAEKAAEPVAAEETEAAAKTQEAVSEDAESANDDSQSAEESQTEEKPAKQHADAAECEKVVTEFLQDMFGAMKMEVSIHSEFDAENDTLNVDLEGPEMGVIIGKRGQTLDSVQYLANLALNRKVDTYTRVKLDTEDYRARRKATLENLAKNVAYKVKRTRKPASLEPMNPYERRIIHAALQHDRYVTTHSEGEEPYRHVVITLKDKQ